jgi:methylated-DNA-[protein]-cysteine S-methyltransferase
MPATLETAVQSTTFDTEWGALCISWRGNDVIDLDPPTNSSKRSTAKVDVPAYVDQLAAALADYFAGSTRWPLVPKKTLAKWLDETGLDGFHRDCLLALVDVPYGQTVTYGELAEHAGRPRAARAAGTACASNPLPIVIPCHRVLPASGGVGNYGFHGPRYKERLLALEGISLR